MKTLSIVTILITFLLGVFYGYRTNAHGSHHLRENNEEIACYGGKVTRVLDGDTFDATLDLGLGVSIKRRLRLFGVDAPEVRTRDAKIKAQGKRIKVLAEDYFRTKLGVRVCNAGQGKFGRLLSVIYRGRESESLNKKVEKWVRESSDQMKESPEKVSNER